MSTTDELFEGLPEHPVPAAEQRVLLDRLWKLDAIEQVSSVVDLLRV